MQLFLGCKGSGHFGTIITGVAHVLRLFEMQHALSSSHISLLRNFWYLNGMGYGLHAIGGPVVGISISNSLVFPTSVDAFDTMDSNLVCNNNESLSQASWET